MWKVVFSMLGSEIKAVIDCLIAEFAVLKFPVLLDDWRVVFFSVLMVLLGCLFHVLIAINSLAFLCFSPFYAVEAENRDGFLKSVKSGFWRGIGWKTSVKILLDVIVSAEVHKHWFPCWCLALKWSCCELREPEIVFGPPSTIFGIDCCGLRLVKALKAVNMSSCAVCLFAVLFTVNVWPCFQSV